MRYIERCENRLTGKLSFTPEEVADGKLTRFIKCLLENQCELHVWTDGYCVIVEYIDEIHSTNSINFQAIDYEVDCIVDTQFVKWDELKQTEKNK